MASGRRKDRELPKGIYEYRKKYMVKIWAGKEGDYEHKYLGLYGTKEEAEYVRNVELNGHHWTGREHDPEGSWGFLYKITNRVSGKMYIGRKQYRLWNGPTGGYKCTDTEGDFFDEDVWKANNWAFYTGSNDEINKEIYWGNIWDFTYEVIAVYKDKLSLHLAEIFEQQGRDVLEALDSNGEYLYYNRNIGGVEFRAPFLRADMEEKMEGTMKKMKAYYLKPRICKKCKLVIPWEEGVCPVCV